ncbi:hypothetical protein ACA910_018766 [Epithemia clementina (nom. ined.)]
MNSVLGRVATAGAVRWAPRRATAGACSKVCTKVGAARPEIILGCNASTRLASSSSTPNIVPEGVYDSSRAVMPKPVVDTKKESLDELGSVDKMYYTDRVDKVAEPERRAFTYLMLSAPHFIYASFARFLVVKFVASIGLAADTLAMAFAEFDVSGMDYGKSMTVTWRGKPMFIRRRTPEEIETERKVPMEHLRDPELDDDRVINPEYVVVLAICPHLGCVPVADAGDYGGYFCPCHGSHYDTVGRIRAGPAPLNLEVPPYKFLDETTIQVG